MLQKFLWEQEDIRQQEIRRSNTFCSPEGRAAFNLINFLPSAKIKNFHGNNLKTININQSSIACMKLQRG